MRQTQGLRRHAKGLEWPNSNSRLLVAGALIRRRDDKVAHHLAGNDRVAGEAAKGWELVGDDEGAAASLIHQAPVVQVDTIGRPGDAVADAIRRGVVSRDA